MTLRIITMPAARARFRGDIGYAFFVFFASGVKGSRGNRDLLSEHEIQTPKEEQEGGVAERQSDSK